MLRWILGLVIAGLVVVAVAAPIGPVPGFWIGGTPTAVPERWNSVKIPGTVQLATQGGVLPRVVNIWIVEVENALYVMGEESSGWVQAVLADSAVSLRMGDTTYELKAERLATLDPNVFESYKARYRADFPEIVASLPADASQFDGGAAFRLKP